MVLLISEDVSRRILSFPDYLESMERAFSEISKKRTIVPDRTTIESSEKKFSLEYMTAYIREIDAIGCSISYSSDDISSTSYIVLQDPLTGRIVMLTEASYIIEMLTAATAAIAIELLSIKDARNLGLFGAGNQAYGQLLAACKMRSIEKCQVFDVNKVKCRNFAELTSKEFGIDVTPQESTRTLVEQSDIITTITTSKTPVFEGKWVLPGTHINGMGSTSPKQRELDTFTICNSKLIVDSVKHCLGNAGDLIIPLEKGILTTQMIHGEIGEIIIGKKEKRSNQEEITVFKSVGVAAQDISVAHTLYEKAIKMGIGQIVCL